MSLRFKDSSTGQHITATSTHTVVQRPISLHQEFSGAAHDVPAGANPHSPRTNISYHLDLLPFALFSKTYISFVRTSGQPSSWRSPFLAESFPPHIDNGLNLTGWLKQHWPLVCKVRFLQQFHVFTSAESNTVHQLIVCLDTPPFPLPFI